jgi:hypothetical protein
VIPGITLAAEEPEEKDVYMGADLNLTAINVGSESLNSFNLRFKLGLDMSTDIIPLLSMESHFGFDITEDSASIDGVDADLHLNHYIALYLKASHKIEEVVRFYGLIGFAAAQMQGDIFVLKDEIATSLSYGLGAGFQMPYDLEGTVEIMQLISSDSYDVMMFSVGINYRM